MQGIEGDLKNAILETKAVTIPTTKNYGITRSSRTDKGVSALGSYASLSR